MKTRILPLLILLAVFGLTSGVQAQLPEAPPPRKVADTPPTTYAPAQNQVDAVSYAPLPVQDHLPTGKCANGNCYNTQGSCLERFVKWLCYKPLPASCCNCQRTCSYDCYPPLYNYFLPASAFTGGHGAGCQNCGH